MAMIIAFSLALSAAVTAQSVATVQSAALAEPVVNSAIASALRAEVSELHERVDFAERLLAQRQEPGKIEAGQ